MKPPLWRNKRGFKGPGRIRYDQNRNIALAVIFSILTCGIYGLYWLVKLNNDMCALTPDDSYQTGGGMVLLLTIITCGIYGWFWAYKMGCKMDRLSADKSHTVLFIILQAIGLGIVNYCIMQSAVNEHATEA